MEPCILLSSIMYVIALLKFRIRNPFIKTTNSIFVFNIFSSLDLHTKFKIHNNNHVN